MSRRSPTNDRYTADRSDRPAGATRKGASSAKPARAAAASVRIESSKSKMTKRQKAAVEATMTKEERKEAKAKQREEENLAYTATSILTNQDEKYKKLRRIWWALLVVAVVFTILSWVTLSTGVGGSVLGIVVLVIAYAGIIGALVMDFTVIRKRRNVSRDKVASMSRRQIERIVDESYDERLAKEAARKAKKEAKKAGRSASEQDAAAEQAYADYLKAAHSKYRAEDTAQAKAGGKKAKGKQGAQGKDAGSTKVSVVDEGAAKGGSAAGSAGGAQGAADAASVEAEDPEAARLAAARKAAQDFAASRR